MKRTFSAILVALLVVVCSLALVGCNGGISSQKKWDQALDYLKNCDSLTITINEKWVTRNTDLIFRETTKTTKIIKYDGKQGILYYNYEMHKYNAVWTEKSGSHTESYYYVEGTSIHSYTRSISDYADFPWIAGDTTDYADAATALAALKEQWLTLTVSDNIEGLNYVDVNLNYADFNSKFLPGRFESQPETDNYTITHQVTFSGGKLNKLSYKKDAKDTSTADDKTETTTKIKYTVDVTLPNDLPTVSE